MKYILIFLIWALFISLGLGFVLTIAGACFFARWLFTKGKR